MPLRSDWPCWEIMKCNDSQGCPAKESSSKLCWEIIKEVDSYSFNICRDCLVYVSKQKNSQFSKEELLSIMAQKGVNVLNGEQCPNFTGCCEE
ncbi:MAG: hypothetical protein KKD01_03170 [Proteobacteria bacterium]|nr:hypothetical protein [Pseudomonadota bacterium]MBU1138522.1 hypothetical protein [Pseudomonadota bacterium]MBU1231468.1 hypothetical protein [Pseudomonadota bacterium]MBU1417008.1 hypothetical protein [Pseudomonadota bacterium]MBU1453704.1 hypothetical protein [Pseudomonadota bacterium]